MPPKDAVNALRHHANRTQLSSYENTHLRLLFVIDSFGSGGAQRQMVNLALGLHRRGHILEFFIYYPLYRHFVDPIERAGIKVHAYPKKHRFSLFVIWKLRQQIIRGNYDAILSFLDTPNFISEIASFGMNSPELVVSERSHYLPGRLQFGKQMLQQFHRLADYISVNSHHQRERMELEFIWMKGKICTIYNGVDIEAFSNTSPFSSKQNESFSLLAVGTIVPHKNPIGLAKALSIYRIRYGNPPIVRWAGKKNDSNEGQKYFRDACKVLESLGIQDLWEWLGERRDIPELIQAHDAVILPSFNEGLPNVICEALSCGRPVIASDINDNPLLVKDGTRGFLFDPTNPENIADAIHRFAITTPVQRKEMGRQARLFAEQKLSMETFVDQYEQLFMKLIKGINGK